MLAQAGHCCREYWNPESFKGDGKSVSRLLVQVAITWNNKYSMGSNSMAGNRPTPDASGSDELDMALLNAVGSMFKWVMASLLLLNGGALVALVQNPNSAPLLTESGKYFAAGAAMSVLGGISATAFLVFIMNIRNIAPHLAEKRSSSQTRRLHNVFDTMMLIICVGCMMASLILFTLGTAEVGEAMMAANTGAKRHAQP